MLILAVLALLVGLGRLISKGVRRLDRNLLDAVGILAIFFAGLHVASPDRRAFELLILLTSVTLFLGVHRKRKMRRLSDNALLVVAVIGIFLAVVFLYLFPINFAQFSWRTSWLQLQYKVLPHWSDYWWFRWGIVAALAAVVAALLVNRARRGTA